MKLILERWNRFLKEEEEEEISSDIERVFRSPKPFTEYRPTFEQRVGPKPEGLWYSCGSAWDDWCRSEAPERIRRSPYLYRIEVNLSRMLVIRNPKEFKEFDSKYKVYDRGMYDIDWSAVAQDWDGIEICPHMYNLSRRREHNWYEGWDVASGCIWGSGAFKSVDFLDSCGKPYTAKSSGESSDFSKFYTAENPKTPPETLTALSQDEDIDIRFLVAGNPSTPPETLAILAGDDFEAIVQIVAQNPSTPPETLVALSQNKDIDIRRLVAANRSTPQKTLTALSKDQKIKVRRSVAGNPSTPRRVLYRLVKDLDFRVVKKLAQNPNTPAEVLTGLSKYKDIDIRFLVAGNPSTPPETLAALSKDWKDDVREKVVENPSAPLEVFYRLAQDTNASIKDKAIGVIKLYKLGLRE